MTTIFATDTPVNNNQNNGAPGITTATRIICNVAGNITSVRWWCPATAPAAAQYVLVRYVAATDSAGAAIGSGNFPALTPNTWNVVSVGPFAMSAGDEFVVEVWNSEGRYVNTLDYFTAGAVNRVQITGPQDDTVTPRRNGRFNVGGAITFPTSGFQGNGYFVDVDFVASSSGATVNAVTVAGTTSIPAPSVRTGETVSGVATVAGTTAIPAPSVRTGETVLGVATVAGVTTIPTPSVRTGETVAGVATVAGVTSIPTPQVQVGATVSPATALGSTSIPAPTISTSQNATVFPATVFGHVTIPTPQVNPSTPTVRPIMTVGSGYQRWRVDGGYNRWRVS